MKTTKYTAVWTTGLFIALALAAAFCPAQLASQANTRLEEQSFDYDPDAGKAAPKQQQFATETVYEDAVTVTYPLYGSVIFSKYRWKSWVTRALYLMLFDVALLALIFAIPKTEEINILAAYVLSGASLAVSFWLFLCAVLIFQLKASAWLYVLPVSAASAIAGYTMLMKIKNFDISLEEVKESFKKPGTVTQEDQRLTSAQGTSGDWPDQDFIK